MASVTLSNEGGIGSMIRGDRSGRSLDGRKVLIERSTFDHQALTSLESFLGATELCVGLKCSASLQLGGSQVKTEGRLDENSWVDMELRLLDPENATLGLFQSGELYLPLGIVASLQSRWNASTSTIEFRNGRSGSTREGRLSRWRARDDDATVEDASSDHEETETDNSVDGDPEGGVRNGR